MNILQIIGPGYVSYVNMLIDVYNKLEKYNCKNLILYQDKSYGQKYLSKLSNSFPLDYDELYNNELQKNELEKIILNFKPDIIHCRQTFNAVLCANLIRNFYNLNIPIVSTIDFFEYMFTYMNKDYNDLKIYNTSDYIFCTQEDLYNNLIKINAINKDKLFVDMNAIDIDLYKYTDKERKDKRKELYIKDNYVCILYMARNVESKGIFHALNAWELFLDRQENKNIYKFFIFGGCLYDESNTIKVNNIINNHKYKDTIINIGWVYNNKEYIKAFDIFINPTINFETFCYALVESMASKLACLVSDTEYPKKILKYGEYGVVYKSKNNMEFVLGLEKIINNLDYYKKKAYERVFNYSLDKTLPLTINKYKEIIKNYNSPLKS